VEKKKGRKRPTIIYVPIIKDDIWLKFTDGDGDDESLLAWADRVASEWIKAYNEILANDALAHLAEQSTSKTLRRHYRRLRELLALRTKGVRKPRDYNTCPICGHDWHLHFVEVDPCQCKKCDCQESLEK
jgi:hypothetical protein